jgi:hypothetical protein
MAVASDTQKMIVNDLRGRPVGAGSEADMQGLLSRAAAARKRQARTPGIKH